jgi:hypothetical protein
MGRTGGRGIAVSLLVVNTVMTLRVEPFLDQAIVAV